MSLNNAHVIVAFALYLAFMLAIGWFFYRRTRNLSDYILGGRGLNSWVAAMSAQASDMSGWLLMGLPGFAYLAGIEAGWIALGLGVGTYLNWKLVAQRLRRYTEAADNSLTIPNYFESRFHDRSHLLRLFSALFILVFFLIYTASGFVAGAKLFSTVFELPYLTALILGALVIITYTFMGGFLAVSWTDFFQGLIMFLAITIVPLMVVVQKGGFNATISALSNLNREFLNPLTTPSGTAISLLAVLSSLAWGLGYFGQPHILARFMAIRNPAKIPRSRHIAMTWVVISLGCAVLAGMAGAALPVQSLIGPDSEKVFILLVERMAHPLIAGIFLSAILAAIMSTADSQLLVTSSAITHDFYKVLLRPRAGERELLWISRLAVLVVAVAALILAMNPENSVLELVAYAWAGFGATFGPLVLISLYWPRMTRKGALAGIIVGGVTVLLWKPLSGGIFDLYEIVPGFLFSALAILVVSLLDKQPPASIKAEFRRINPRR
ncbi:MAG TPA: sodium/proline symporter PutP [Candidatus Aminicenantes bacterium]|nr:sodium/proline symporter PutP [Candidatus Aminicenantes bacterium]